MKKAPETKEHYSVGDTDVIDYWHALDVPNYMEKPRWRQPDTVGRPRTKVGVNWLRKTRDELEVMFSSIPDDLPESKRGNSK